ncbi:CaiB/BaiF CoA-transferase family protein [Nocardioides endophyticus]|uniref:CaiB/BaiF CoA-transferase family protein n=1 Tax=Nocardioides endophyticus TaxID=1353775 RepID=A0ABP8ZCL2_9ACTN
MAGPLAGISIVELGGLGPSAFATMLMADLGADVVRVDRARPAHGGVEATSAPKFDLLNRGKRSLALDLKRPEAVEIVLSLVDCADALTDPFRPGVAERLGLGPTECLARNPRLVYARMTGWGQEGPLASTAGHDINYIALTGALHGIGAAGGPPTVPVNYVGDFGGGGTYLVIGLLAALREAAATGIGQVVDAAIVDGVSHLLSSTHAMYAGGLWQDQRGVNVLDGGAPFYSVYECADGQHVAVGAGEGKFYSALLQHLGLNDDPRHQLDESRWPDLRRRIADVFLTKPRDVWAAELEHTDCCVTPVLGLVEAAEHPHLKARGSLRTRDGVLQAGSAPRFSGAVPDEPTAPPLPGEHSRQILVDLGLDVEGLIADGVAIAAT